MKDDAPIVRLFFAKIKPSFTELPESERNEFMAKDRANIDELGMKAISMIQCSGMDDEWDYIGVEGWLSLDDIKKREEFENKVLQISKYVTYKTHLGLEKSFDSYGK
jgi:hypothetical protein